MTWDIDWKLGAIPHRQKWFAVGEAIAHLRYLEGEGQIKRNTGERL